MKLAFSSLCCDYIDDILKLAKSNADRSIEWDLNFIPFTLSEKRIDYIKTLIDESDISIRFHLPYSFIEIAHTDAKIRRFSKNVLKMNLDFIKKIGGHVAILHIGYFDDSDEALALDSLKEIAKYAYESDILLCVENLLKGLTTDVSFLKKCFNISNVYFCLDTGHAEYIRQKYDLHFFDKLKVFKELIVHAHVYHIEDDEMNHVSFDEVSISNYLWFDLINNGKCEWMTMELGSLLNQNKQIQLIKRQYIK